MPPKNTNNNNNNLLHLLNVEQVHLPLGNLTINEKTTKKIIYQPEGHPKQAIIDGEIWPPVFEVEAVRSAKTMKPLPSDVFVCTYPKCGTTWIQHICSQLLFCSEYGPHQGKVAELCTTSPMIERVGADYCNKLQHPRLLKTHFSHHNCPQNNLSKYIFACRNPKDCLVSYYHHNKNFKIYDWADGNFDQFFQLFIEGKLAFGDYFEHLNSWLPQKLNNKNLLFLKYEDMLKDLKGTIISIAKFLGENSAKLIENSQILEKIIKESQLESMQQNQTRWFPGNALHNESFIRKGCARDWKNYLSREQSDLIDEIFKQRMAGTEAENWWKDEMRWEDEEEENEEYKQQTEEETTNNDSGMESGDDEENCFESQNRRDSVTSECYSTTSCSSDTSSNF